MYALLCQKTNNLQISPFRDIIKNNIQEVQHAYQLIETVPYADGLQDDQSIIAVDGGL